LSRYLWIAAGAALGANARYLVAMWAGGRFGIGFPYGTVIVNATGSFVLGFLAMLLTERVSNAIELRLFLIIGFLGAYTTFSSFAIESVVLLQNGSFWRGTLNIATNNFLSLFCALLGMYVGRLVH
jgi:CrcB protein